MFRTSPDEEGFQIERKEREEADPYATVKSEPGITPGNLEGVESRVFQIARKEALIRGTFGKA